MKFFYHTQTDVLGIRFKAGSGQEKKKETLPGVSMFFDKKGQLSGIEIVKASEHQPELKTFVGDLLTEITRSAQTLPREVLLAIEKTIKLGEADPNTSEEGIPNFAPRLSFDAMANVVVTEFRELGPGEGLLPKQEIIPHVVASFGDNGHLVTLEMHKALEHMPALRQFIDQGNELLALQQFFK